MILRDVLSPLNSKSAEEVTVTQCPMNITDVKKYIIKGKIQNVGFRRWVRKKALEADLCGHAQNLKNGDLVVMVAGTVENVKKFKSVCEKGPQKSSVSTVEETEWNQPVKIGFEIKDTPKLKEKVNKQKGTKLKKATDFQRIRRRIRG